MKSILLIEEQNLFRHALTSLINHYANCEVVCACESVEKLSRTEKHLKPDIVLLAIYDIQFSADSVIEEAKKLFPLAKIIVFSDDINQSNFSKLVSHNIYAFFSSNAGPRELENLLVDFDKYEPHYETKIDSYTREVLRSNLQNPENTTLSFSNRESEILNLVCQEQTNTEISNTLGLSVRTVESFRRRMIIKAGCKNMVGVVVKAFETQQLGLAR